MTGPKPDVRLQAGAHTNVSRQPRAAMPPDLPEDVVAIFRWAQWEGTAYWEFPKTAGTHSADLPAADLAVQPSPDGYGRAADHIEASPRPLRPWPAAEGYAARDAAEETPFGVWEKASMPERNKRLAQDEYAPDAYRKVDGPRVPSQGEPDLPAWFGELAAVQARERHGAPGETLQSQRERVASRWYALRNVFDPATFPDEDGQPVSPPEDLPPVLALFSLAGGVGKTSLAAALTRVLAAHGERVLLVDRTAHSVLPFFFGAQDARSEGRRTFSPPPGTMDPPVHLVDYSGPNESSADLRTRLTSDSRGLSRIVVDVLTGSTADLHRLLELGGSVLVPVLPDMNSLLSLRFLRRVLEQGAYKDGSTRGSVTFVLTQFDASQPLHLDLREVLQQELGEQLLPFVVRRSPAVAESLAQGMTAIDYVPGDGIARDLQQLAAWVRTLAEPAREGLGQARWSER